MAKAPKHPHEAVREDYHRIVYAETLEAAQKARAAFLLKWKRPASENKALQSLNDARSVLAEMYEG